jgi:hypothetical protein
MDKQMKQFSILMVAWIIGMSVQAQGKTANDLSEAATIKIAPAEATLLTGLPDELDILSLNNSLIDNNDQPKIFEPLATAAGKTAHWTKQTHLGQSLRYHFEGDGGASKAVVRSKSWTHILLQEQSNKPLTNPSDFLASVKLWVDYIKANCPNPNAKVILTLNWPYTDAADFAGDAKTLYDNYKKVSQELGVSICPVGAAYDSIRVKDGVAAKNALYTDNRHPTMLATYLSACTLYATFYNESPVGITYRPSGVSADNAARMQTRAWEAYQGHADVVDDLAGIVRYAYAVYDQSNQLVDTDLVNVNWNAEGGSIDANGIFTSNGEKGDYEISIHDTNLDLSATARLHVVDSPVIEKNVEIQNNGQYTQDFDEIGTEANAVLPQGWRIDKNTTTPRSLGTYYAATNQTEQSGGNNIASNATNGIYNFGAGDAATATDRAIGGITTGVGTANGADCVNMYLKIKNTGASAIEGFTIQYDIEKYRKGNNAEGFVVQMYYSGDGINWISAGDNFKTFFEKDDKTEGYDSAPGDYRNVSAVLSQPLVVNGMLYLAWNYSVASGTQPNAAQALGLDNIVIETTTSPCVEIQNEEEYEQNFDGLGIEPDAALPLGWKIEKRLDNPRTVGTYAAAANQTERRGGNNIASNAKNGIYNFAAGDSTDMNITDRAIGGISTGVDGGTRCVNMYLKIKNTGTTVVNRFEIRYDVEKYRKGNNAAGFAMQLYYSQDGTTWTSAGTNFRTFFAKDDITGGYDFAPGDFQNVNAVLSQSLAAEGELYLAWNYSVASGTDPQGAQALGLDNVFIKATNDTGINIPAISNDPAVATHYYNLQGMKIDQPVTNGIYLVKTIHTSHKTSVSKVMITK